MVKVVTNEPFLIFLIMWWKRQMMMLTVPFLPPPTPFFPSSKICLCCPGQPFLSLPSQPMWPVRGRARVPWPSACAVLACMIWRWSLKTSPGVAAVHEERAGHALPRCWIQSKIRVSVSRTNLNLRTWQKIYEYSAFRKYPHPSTFVTLFFAAWI